MNIKFSSTRFFLVYIFCSFTAIWADPVLTDTKYIWNTGLAIHADLRPDSFHETFIDPQSYMKNYNPNQKLIWIQPCFLKLFYLQFLKKFRHPVTLIVNTTDDSFPDCLENNALINHFLKNPKIKHVFAQNCTISNHPKVTQIPIGVDFHTLAFGKNHFGERKTSCQQQESKLLACKTLGQSITKSMLVFGDFHLNDTARAKSESRTEIYQRLKNNPCMYFIEKPLPRTQLWLKKINYAFSICPHGNGLDTHRIWEDLILGLIPITKTSPLDPLYSQFPIVIVQNWDEITPENLEKWYQEKISEFDKEEVKEKLTQKYWLKLIKQKTYENSL